MSFWEVLAIFSLAYILVFALLLRSIVVVTFGKLIVWTKKRKILAIPEVMSIIFGSGDHTFKNREFFADASISVCVNRNERLSGIIGFDFESGVVVVQQLQGLKRGSFHDGVLPGEYLLPIAEKLAQALGAKKIVVQSAIFHPNFATKKSSQSDEWLVAKKRRMLANYDEVCRTRGYKLSPLPHQWWKKSLKDGGL